MSELNGGGAADPKADGRRLDPQRPEAHQSRRHHKFRKVMLGIVSRALTNVGWITLSYFLWGVYSEVGIALSVLSLFCAPVLEAIALTLPPRKLALVVLSWSISTLGWLSLMYFLWMVVDPIGILISAALILSGDIGDIYLFLL